MGFGGHLIRMLGVKHTRATLVFGRTREPGEDRKTLAEELYEEVLRLSRDAVLVE